MIGFGAEDPIIPLYAKMLESELHGEGLGERLYIDLIRTQLAIHLLRRYANVEFRQPKLGSLSPRLRRMMTEFIDQNLSENITLERSGASRRTKQLPLLAQI